MKIAELAYNAYAASTGGLTFDGRPLPVWAKLPERIQNAWLVSAGEVVHHVIIARYQGLSAPLDTNRTADVLAEVYGERGRQDARWGVQNHPPLYWLGICGEEYGEISKALIEAGPVHLPRHFLTAARAELVQLAASCVAMIESLDRNELAGEQ